MTNQTLTVSEYEFYKAGRGKGAFILRQEAHDDLDFGRREKPRNRPLAGKLIEIGIDRPHSVRYVFRIKDVKTVAIYQAENHPLWVDGEPVKHADQELFAQLAGHDSWESFSGELYCRYGAEFNGYSIEV